MLSSAEEGLELERERDESHVWGSVSGSGLELETEVQIWAGKQEFQTHVTQGLSLPKPWQFLLVHLRRRGDARREPGYAHMSDILELTLTHKSKLH